MKPTGKARVIGPMALASPADVVTRNVSVLLYRRPGKSSACDLGYPALMEKEEYLPRHPDF